MAEKKLRDSFKNYITEPSRCLVIGKVSSSRNLNRDVAAGFASERIS